MSQENTAPPESKVTPKSRWQRVINHYLVASFFSAALSYMLAYISVSMQVSFGVIIFFALPVFLGVISTCFFSYRRVVRFSAAFGVGMLSMLFLGAMILVTAMDGLGCLLMALPLATPMVALGCMLGLLLASFSIKPYHQGIVPFVLFCSFPLLVSFENSQEWTPPTRQVVTSVWIDAPIQKVWDTVIAFPKIHEKPKGIFRLGIAYPTEASIHGHGIGAVRCCTFNTGDFVEPITAWDEPNLLAFDVSENPLPMKEVSLYKDLDVPHLHGKMISEKGQFRLIQEGDRVRLEGTTWYHHRIAPQWYWGPVSDLIIKRIHLRVLEHIQREAEGRSTAL